MDEDDDTTLYRRDWLYLLFILLIAAYTGGLIALYEFAPERFAALPLPLQALGYVCAESQDLIQHVNLLALPMIAASILYHVIDRRALGKPVSKGNLAFSAACWLALPPWLAASCEPAWLGDVSSGLVILMQDYSLGALIYAALLLSLCNGVSYLLAAGLLGLFRPPRVVP